MSQPPTGPPAPRPGLYELRLLAAGVCKDLMRARLAGGPSGFDPDTLAAWGVEPGPPPNPAWQYLLSAADTLDRLQDEFEWEYHASSLGDPAEELPEHRVIRGCAWLVPREGEERPAVALRAVAEAVRGGSAGEWWRRFRWELLGGLRDRLNLLPSVEGPDRTRVQWDRAKRELWVDGRVVLTLSATAASQTQVLNAFQSAGWVYSVKVPGALTPGGRRETWLEYARNDLNKRQKRIRFTGDRSGDGVCYQILPDPAEPAPRVDGGPDDRVGRPRDG